VVFARLLLFHLDSHADDFRRFSLIVSSPTYTSNRGEARRWDHIRLITRQAHAMGEGRWPFDVANPAAIIKTENTPKMTPRRWRGRLEIAENELRDALHVPDPTRTRGRDILIFEDIFTDG